MSVEVRVLGPMEIARGGAAVRVPSRRQQVLLALLVAQRGGVVPASTLADALWPADQPASARKSLQLQVHRLRRALGDASAVLQRAPGYALALPPASVDAYRFEELAQRGRAALVRGDAAAAAALLRRAGTEHRGRAFPGLDDVDGLGIESRRLDELRLAALEDRFTAELALGESAALAGELAPLVAEHPLRERFRIQLMTALYRAGRRADALATYHEGQQRWRAELAAEPSPECQRVAQAIQAGDPVPAQPAVPSPGQAADQPAPRQLPADVPGFTGRAQPLRSLDRLLRPTGPEEPAGGRVHLVEGMAGAGKTALAVHWGHRVAGRFPDGQLYVNLHGPAGSHPLAPQPALARFLRALGMPDGQIPADLEGAAAAYRGLLAGKRVLVLLDNAASADQVRPLLPAGGGSVALVTSRDRLDGVGGVGRVVLGPLPPGEARRLLTRLLGGRVGAEPDAAAELVERCGRLALALRIAAANLTARPGLAIADYLGQLRGTGRLAALAVAGDEQAAVAAAFAVSYRRLPAPARRLFRLLGLVPGPDFTVATAAALAGSTGEQARRQLARLAAAHLVEEPVPGRYTCHDLLRVYAGEQARADETPAARSAATDRLLTYYAEVTDTACRLLSPHALRPPWALTGGAREPTGLTDREAALRWLDAEWPNLTAVVPRAAAAGPHPAAWLITDALRPYLLRRAPAADGVALAESGAAAAAAAGDPGGQGCARYALAGTRYLQGDTTRAIADFRRARDCFRVAGWAEGEAGALADLGSAYAGVGQPALALRCFTEALPFYRRLGSGFGQAAVISNLADLLVELGRLPQALAHARRALAGCTRLGFDYGVAVNLATIGRIHHLRGEFGLAAASLTQAQTRYRAAGDRGGEGNAWSQLADVCCATGRPAEAVELADAALRVACESGNREREIRAHRALARAYGLQDEPAKAGRHGGQALALARAAGHRFLEVEVLIDLAGRLLHSGEPAAALARADEAAGIARQAGYRLLEAHAHATLAQARLRTGDTGAARRHRARARRLSAALGLPAPRTWR